MSGRASPHTLHTFPLCICRNIFSGISWGGHHLSHRIDSHWLLGVGRLGLMRSISGRGSPEAGHQCMWQLPGCPAAPPKCVQAAVPPSIPASLEQGLDSEHQLEASKGGQAPRSPGWVCAWQPSGSVGPWASQWLAGWHSLSSWVPGPTLLCPALTTAGTQQPWRPPKAKHLPQQCRRLKPGPGLRVQVVC